jgi:hypothetical protein
MPPHIRASCAAVALLCIVTGCAAGPSAVPVQARHADLAALDGEWRGMYEGEEGGRSGSIAFRIVAQVDSAYGDVLMIPRPETVSPFPTVLTGTPEPQLLQIAFVRIGRGRVRGEIAEYLEPTCHCRLTSSFEGQVSGDIITGTFTTWRQDSSLRQTGRWRVVRQAVPARLHH